MKSTADEKVRVIICITVQDNFAGEFAHGADLDLWRRERHHDDGTNAATSCGQGDTLTVIAG